MREPSDINGTFVRALELAALGYFLIPLEFGGKTPARPWKDAPALGPDDIARIAAEPYLRPNFGVVAGRSGVVVLDCDDELAQRWVAAHCPPSPMQVSTPRGGRHFYYRAPAGVGLTPRVGAFGIGLDVRAGASLAVVPESWSATSGRRWRFLSGPVAPSALPLLPPAAVERLAMQPAEPCPTPKTQSPGWAASRPIRDVRRWIMAVESVQGAGGSNQCFRAACRLVDAGLPWDEAWRVLCLWNESGRAIPPWSEAELQHKLRDAFARATT